MEHRPAAAPSGEPFISVVIPVFHSEQVIRATIEAVRAHAARHGWELQIVVSISRGGDETEALVRQAVREFPEVEAVDASAAFGKGGAVKAGMLRARGRVCCFIDADNGVSFDQIDAALPLLQHHDVVIGSRYVPGGDPGRRALPRIVLSRGGNVLIKLLLGLRYADTRAPLKVFTREASMRLFERVRLRGFGFDSELLFLAGRFGFRVYELPVRWQASEDSTVRIGRDAARSIMELLEVRWHSLRGHYR